MVKEMEDLPWLTPEEKQEEKFYRNGKLDGQALFGKMVTGAQ